MRTTWERFYGREDRFALRVALREDPDPGFAEPDLSASWGSFQIWVEGKNLCAHVDQGETLESVHWYLLPLLEWVAASWDPLLHEERLPARMGGTSAVESLRETALPPLSLGSGEQAEWQEMWFDWWRRHAFRSARDGGPFPDVVLRRWRDRVECSWGDSAIAGGEGLEFLASQGVARLTPAEVAQPLLELLDEVAAELATRVSTERLAGLRAGIAAIAAPPGGARNRLAWMAGLRIVGDSMSDSWARVEKAFAPASERAREAALGVTQTWGVVQGSCQAALLFGAVAPEVTIDDVEQLAGLLIRQYDPQGDPSDLRRLVESRPLATTQPAWQDGYELADEVREELGLPPDEPLDIHELFAQLGLSSEDLTLDDPAIRGVALASPQHRPTVVINGASVYGQSREAERFTMTHELCHLLFDRDQGSRLAVASGPWAPREIEQRANAFAAYLLMPPKGLLKYKAGIRNSASSREGVEELARLFGVSPTAMVEHLPNAGLITYEDRARLRAW